MSLLTTLANIAAVLLSQREPYPDEPDRGVIGTTDRGVLVKAFSGTDALDQTVKGQTAEGSATFAAVHKGGGVYEVRREEF